MKTTGFIIYFCFVSCLFSQENIWHITLSDSTVFKDVLLQMHNGDTLIVYKQQEIIRRLPVESIIQMGKGGESHMLLGALGGFILGTGLAMIIADNRHTPNSFGLDIGGEVFLIPFGLIGGAIWGYSGKANYQLSNVSPDKKAFVIQKLLAGEYDLLFLEKYKLR